LEHVQNGQQEVAFQSQMTLLDTPMNHRRLALLQFTLLPAALKAKIKPSTTASTLTFGVVPQQAAVELARIWVPMIGLVSQRCGIGLRFATASNAGLIAGGQLEMVKSILGDDFIRSLEKALTKLKSDFLQLSQYMSRSAPLKARGVSHSIRNTAGDLGASALHVFIAKIRAQFRENRIDSTQLSALERLISKTKDALRQRTSMAGR
jgi:hypothetical protein